ncbi:MAG: hypothetical protein M1817_006003 [Caeruleum heppii]|nr:MAG: hypothetical protein M1817_006003 [Caeruleum heppii]
MGGGEYAAVTGGSLKLKGFADSKIDKKRKKKKKAAPEKQIISTEDDVQGVPSPTSKEGVINKDEVPEISGDEDTINVDEAAYLGKTEAEKRHEEMRRKRQLDRLRREGVKTHKERVEELNKYLSNLSEHHDMPRIGPG